MKPPPPEKPRTQLKWNPELLVFSSGICGKGLLTKEMQKKFAYLLGFVIMVMSNSDILKRRRNQMKTELERLHTDWDTGNVVGAVDKMKISEEAKIELKTHIIQAAGYDVTYPEYYEYLGTLIQTWKCIG